MNDIFSSMRQRITFQSESTSSDSGGGSTLAWVDVATVWAEVKPVAGFANHGIAAEKFNAGQMEDRAQFIVTTRFVSGITTKMRILFGVRVFNILSIANVDERGEILRIWAEEGVGI
jgi:SPP1 family predicted phage head-tail adaptor